MIRGINLRFPENISIEFLLGFSTLQRTLFFRDAMKLHIYNTLSREKELFVPLMEDPNYKGPKKNFV